MRQYFFPAIIILSLIPLSCKPKSAAKTEAIIACGPPNKEFGTVHFVSACNKATESDFNVGIAMLHSFEYDESEKAFAKVIDTDPNCAMAYWGIAMSNFHQVWPSPPTAEELAKGSRAIEKARSMVDGNDIRSEYIHTISAFYQDYQKFSQRERILNYATAMEKMYQKYSSDKEVTVFYALSLISAADPADKSFALQKKAGKLLTDLYPGQPLHPGILHYIIHAYDSPELASLALDAARKYATIAPASSHAQHMPSHIFTRLGLWDEDIASNIRAMESAKCYAQNTGIKGHWDEELHDIDYLVYAYLQKHDTLNAAKNVEYLLGFTDVSPVNFKVLYAFAATPGRYYLENKLWQKASDMRFQPNMPWQKFPWQKAIVHFVRALGASNTGNTEKSNAELKEMKSCYDSLVSQKDDYKANQVKIQMTIAEAWILYAEGNKNEALQRMREAVIMEDKTEKSPVTPGELLPARQLLGDMLMLMKRPAEALTEYQEDLKKHPNRYNSLQGVIAARNN